MKEWRKMTPLRMDVDFLADFKRITESCWAQAEINPAIWGSQMQRGTRWNPGLTEAQLAEYERALGARFPNDFRRMLRAMNGTDIPMLDVRGSSGEPYRTSSGVYSYPRDLELVKTRIEDVRGIRAEMERELADQGFVLETQAALVPVFAHRFIVCGSDSDKSVVLSIHGTDAIVYGKTLRAYLEAEFLR